MRVCQLYQVQEKIRTLFIDTEMMKSPSEKKIHDLEMRGKGRSRVFLIKYSLEPNIFILFIASFTSSPFTVENSVFQNVSFLKSLFF